MKDYSKIAKDCDEYADHFDGFIGELLNYACGAIKELQSRLESLEQEMQDQARIIGMGAERELALVAKVESLEKDAARYRWFAERRRRAG